LDARENPGRIGQLGALWEPARIEDAPPGRVSPAGYADADVRRQRLQLPAVAPPRRIGARLIGPRLIGLVPGRRARVRPTSPEWAARGRAGAAQLGLSRGQLLAEGLQIHLRLACLGEHAVPFLFLVHVMLDH